jgi:hypothetical protein
LYSTQSIFQFMSDELTWSAQPTSWRALSSYPHSQE